MPQQLTFDLPARLALGRDSFLEAPSNALALKGLSRWRDWPAGRAVLVGPAGSGKTHLAHVWAEMTGARLLEGAALERLGEAALPALTGGGALILDDAQALAGRRASEALLFHLVNLCADSGTALLLTARVVPSGWGLVLPDLSSRLQVAQLLQLAPPDDALLAALLVKLFADRQLTVSPRLIDWLVGRMERSALAAQRIVARLDHAALEQKRPITRQLAAAVLEEMAPADAASDALRDRGSDSGNDLGNDLGGDAKRGSGNRSGA